MIYAIIALVLFLSGMGAGYEITNWKNEAEKAADLRAQVAAQAAEDKRTAEISATFQKGLASLRASGQTNTSKVTNELLQQVYSKCLLPESGRLLHDATADQLNDAAGLGSAVPAAPAPTGPAVTKPLPAAPVVDGKSLLSGDKFTTAVRGVRAKSEAAARAKGGSTPASQ
jgi:hypothetical protein